MKLKETSIAALTNFYWLARKSRLLDTALGRKTFSTSYFLYKRYLEDPYRELVDRHPEFFRSGNILDIGANIGYTASVFARAISPGYKVYAFEPERFNYGLLEHTARTRRAADRIVPIRSAVGDRDGTIDLWENEHHHGDHRILTDQFRLNVSSGAVAVPITRLDTFLAKQHAEFAVRFVKVDVQGYELPVCLGMERTLTLNPRAILALEYSPSAMRELGFQPEVLINWLIKRDYRVSTLEKNGRLRPGIRDFSDGYSYCDLLFSRERLSEPT